MTPLVLSTKYYSSCVARWQALYIKKTVQNTAQAFICLYAVSQLVTGAIFLPGKEVGGVKEGSECDLT